MPAIAPTAASGASSRSSTGPCSMCTSTKVPGGVGGPRRRRRSPSAVQRLARRVTPSASVAARSRASRSRQTARLPKQPRPNRQPSSSRKTTTVASVRVGCQGDNRLQRGQHAQRPVERARRWAPCPGASRTRPRASRAAPGRRPNRLPAPSVEIVQPGLAHPARDQLACRCSSTLSPGGWCRRARHAAPIRASSSSRSMAARRAGGKWCASHRLGASRLAAIIIVVMD